MRGVFGSDGRAAGRSGSVLSCGFERIGRWHEGGCGSQCRIGHRCGGAFADWRDGQIRYEPIECPNGDVPRERGVCTDVLIRALRDSRGVDLQPLIYTDMKWHRWADPLKSVFQSVDSSIVHRRVLNMECYSRRRGWTVLSNAVADFLPGDIVTCRVSGTLPHVMIVSDRCDTNGVPLVIHNIGRGTKEDSYLFANAVEGHFRCPTVDKVNWKKGGKDR